MTAVNELIPGDKVTLLDTSATFVAQTEHPIWPSLRLVIWRMEDRSWSHDALDARQEVGEVDRVDPLATTQRLRDALLGDPR